LNTTTKTYGGAKVWHYAFLNSVIDGSEWSVSFYGNFTSRETVPSTRWEAGWSTEPMWMLEEKKAAVHARNQTPDSLVV